MNEYSFEWARFGAMTRRAYRLDVEASLATKAGKSQYRKPRLERLLSIWRVLTDETLADDPWRSKTLDHLSSLTESFDATSKFWEALLKYSVWNGPHPAIEPSPPPMASDKYSWLPTDFAISVDGAVSALGYINNLPTRCRDLHTTIERIVGAFVPMFERVM